MQRPMAYSSHLHNMAVLITLLAGGCTTWGASAPPITYVAPPPAQSVAPTLDATTTSCLTPPRVVQVHHVAVIVDACAEEVEVLRRTIGSEAPASSLGLCVVPCTDDTVVPEAVYVYATRVPPNGDPSPDTYFGLVPPLTGPN